MGQNKSSKLVLLFLHNFRIISIYLTQCVAVAEEQGAEGQLLWRLIRKRWSTSHVQTDGVQAIAKIYRYTVVQNSYLGGFLILQGINCFLIRFATLSATQLSS